MDMIKKLVATALVLSTVAFAQDSENTKRSYKWTDSNVPKGCFPIKDGAMMTCEDYKSPDDRTIKIIDDINNKMYLYIKRDKISSSFTVVHCNNVMMIPNKIDDQTMKELTAGNHEPFLNLLKLSILTGDWGWNCNGSRYIKNVICLLSGSNDHYAKITNYDEFGLEDSSKDSKVYSAIGDFCRDRIDGI